MSNERIITVAAAQIPQDNNPERNLARMLYLMNSSMQEIICFPENSLSGTNTQVDLYPYHKALAERAREKNLYVVYGCYEDLKRNPDSPAIYNMVYMIDNRGLRCASYAKINLWDEPGVKAGNKIDIINTPLGKFGFAASWDLAHDFPIREYGKREIDVLFCPSYWYGREYRTTEVIDKLPLSTAFKNQFYVVYTDAYAENGDTPGKSKICSPLRVLAEAKPQQEDVIVANLNLSKLKEWRDRFNCWK